MALSTKHPAYSLRIDDWRQMRDTYAGERTVKNKGFVYLSPTSGMLEDGANTGNTSAPGWQAYDAYRKRAVFPDAVSEAVEALIGAMHRKPPVIELPDSMEYLRELATINGESLEMLLRRINEEQLVSGRVGLLADVIDSGDRSGEVYFATYNAEHIINWDDGARDVNEPQKLNLVVLDESEDERDAGFEWRTVEKYRVLILGEPDANENAGIYRVGVFREANAAFNAEALIEPSVAGRTLDEIPFEFINSKDIVTTPDDPPLLGLSNLALAIYRGEADWRQALFMQGQDTLVTQGLSKEDTIRTGAGAHISLPLQGDAKFIGVESSGLTEMREGLQNDYNRAAEMSGKLLDTVSRERESGDALRIRVAARTATLNQIAKTGAGGLQAALRKVAKWLGADPEAVTVTPNLDFSDEAMTGKSLTELMAAKMLNAPISLRTIHRLMEQRGVTDLTFEEEIEQIELEVALELAGAGGQDEEDQADDQGEGGGGQNDQGGGGSNQE